MKSVTTEFKSGGLHEKHVVATWNVGNHLSICLYTQGNQEKPVSRWPVAGPSEYWLLASSPVSKAQNKQQCTHSTTNTHKMTTIHTRQLQQYTRLNHQQLHTSRRTATDPRLRPRGHRDQRIILCMPDYLTSHLEDSFLNIFPSLFLQVVIWLVSFLRRFSVTQLN